MTKTKKIIIFTFVVIVLGLLAWWFFSRNSGSDVQVGGIGNGSNSGFSIKNFFPFGNADDEANDGDGGSSSDNNGSSFNNENPDSTNPVAGSVPIQRLRKLWDKPVAGATIWNKGSTSIVRFTEKATGNVYEAKSDSVEIRRLTNETNPKIIRAFWLPDASGFLAQGIDENETIETSFVGLKLSSSSSTLPYVAVISKLPTGIKELSVSPNSKKIFYYVSGATAKGYVSNPDGTSVTNVYNNFLTEWIPTWFSDNSILLSGKASFTTGSSGFFLNPNNKTLVKAYENITGTGLARVDGKFILLGTGADPYGSLPNLWIKDIAKGTFSSLNIVTLPEKCTWNKADPKFIFCGVPKLIQLANYPDDWYRGIASTDDLVQKINVFDAYKYVLSDLSVESKEVIDTENLSAGADGNFLIFQNKLDQSLWMLDTR